MSQYACMIENLRQFSAASLLQALTESQSVCNMAISFRCDFLQLQKQLLGVLPLGFREIKLKLPILADLVAFRLYNLCARLYYLSLHLFCRFCKIHWHRKCGSLMAQVPPIIKVGELGPQIFSYKR